MGNLAMRTYVKSGSGDNTRTNETKTLFKKEDDSDSNSPETESQPSILIAGSRNVAASMSSTRKRDTAAHLVELPVSAMPEDPS